MHAQMWIIWVMSGTFGYFIAGPIWEYLLEWAKKGEVNDNTKDGKGG